MFDDLEIKITLLRKNETVRLLASFRTTYVCFNSLQVLFMKNMAEMEDLTSIIEKFSSIAIEVLEGTQFR